MNQVNYEPVHTDENSPFTESEWGVCASIGKTKKRCPIALTAV